MKAFFSNKLCIVGITIAVVLSSGCTAMKSQTAPPVASATSASDSTPIAISATPAGKPTTLPSGVFNWNDLVVKTSDFGDQRSVFRSPTATLDELEVHMTTLLPGQRPHAPHQHPYEEMVVLKEGTLEVTINDRVSSMPAGSVLFLAPDDMHGWRNVGAVPAKYVIITWKMPRSSPAK